MTNQSQDEKLLRQLMSGRLANGAGLIMLALSRLGEARAFALMRQACLDQRGFFKDLQVLVKSGLVLKTDMKPHPLYSLSDEGKRMISCHVRDEAKPEARVCDVCIFNQRKREK